MSGSNKKLRHWLHDSLDRYFAAEKSKYNCCATMHLNIFIYGESVIEKMKGRCWWCKEKIK